MWPPSYASIPSFHYHMLVLLCKRVKKKKKIWWQIYSPSSEYKIAYINQFQHSVKKGMVYGRREIPNPSIDRHSSLQDVTIGWVEGAWNLHQFQLIIIHCSYYKGISSFFCISFIHKDKISRGSITITNAMMHAPYFWNYITTQEKQDIEIKSYCEITMLIKKIIG